MNEDRLYYRLTGNHVKLQHYYLINLSTFNFTIPSLFIAKYLVSVLQFFNQKETCELHISTDLL